MRLDARLRSAVTTRLLSIIRLGVSTVFGENGTIATVSEDEIPRLEPWGLASHPPAGIRGLVALIGGALDLPIFFGAVGHTRPDVAEGDTILYSDHDAQVRLTEDGIETVGPITTDDDVAVGGGLDVTGGYAAGGVPGGSGTLTITISAPPGVATITVTDGIVTNVVATGACVWVPA